ncbi:MAG: hypothetical protein CEE42_16490 [Promethearchaeota archaeon Loki_b31]|nr:MAG: hypothetical protein CEE42_16490 [Candidatus Lokiarchaeota archaeon Loki_b31]
MERKVILKWLSIFSVSFFILSIVELLDLIIFSTVISMNLDGQQFTIINVIFQSGFMSIHAPLLWIFLLCVICAFIALAISIYRVAKKQIIENFNLAKFMLLIGLFLVIGGFIKMSFIVLLGNNTISTGSTTITFQNALYSPTITPVIGAIMWVYFIVVVCSFLVSGLIFGGVGLQWMLLIQNEKVSQEK